MKSPNGSTTRFVGLLALALQAGAAYSHGDAPWGVQPLPWTTNQISRSIAAYGTGQVVSVGNQKCITGQGFAFDVLDSYAFDIDETVSVDVDFYDPPAVAEMQLTYDRADRTPVGNSLIKVSYTKSGHMHKQSFVLQHARFANLGFNRTDFSLGVRYTEGVTTPPITICDLSIRRVYPKTAASPTGEVVIQIMDEDGRPTPARMGLYDRQGRLPLPSTDAITLQSLSGRGRVIQFPLDPGSPVPLWPNANRSAFYAKGHYRARLPAENYDLVVSKGLEYRLANRRFSVQSQETTSLTIRLQRWQDLAKNGWISGDDHIHYALENDADDRALQIFTQAEDIKVANILHMGNVVRTYFPQHRWEPIFNAADDRYVLVPGQEDPRTSRRGHTLSLNLREPVRDPSRYPLYHEILEKIHAQGGLSGYAHVTLGHRNLHAVSGMAVDVPFGLVDFAEILSGPCFGDSDWFDFLNLGYKISPTAGTDYIYGSLPGAVRTYVKLDRSFTPQAWFDALKNGRTFVTNGPVLNFTVNGKEVGSDIHIKSGETMVIAAAASLNPDFGALATLELIEQGEVVKRAPRNGAVQINLNYKTTASHGTWFVVRATGAKKGILAMSAPIYASVDGQSFWKRSEVPSIVARLKASMVRMLESEVSEGDNEGWESQTPLAETWRANEVLLETRVDQATAKLDELVKRAEASAAAP